MKTGSTYIHIYIHSFIHTTYIHSEIYRYIQYIQANMKNIHSIQPYIYTHTYNHVTIHTYIHTSPQIVGERLAATWRPTRLRFPRIFESAWAYQRPCMGRWWRSPISSSSRRSGGEETVRRLISSLSSSGRIVDRWDHLFQSGDYYCLQDRSWKMNSYWLKMYVWGSRHIYS